MEANIIFDGTKPVLADDLLFSISLDGEYPCFNRT
jgi:hypothetical protein